MTATRAVLIVVGIERAALFERSSDSSQVSWPTRARDVPHLDKDNGASSSAVTKLKIAVFAPTPNASVSATITVKEGCFSAARAAHRTSCVNDSFILLRNDTVYFSRQMALPALSIHRYLPPCLVWAMPFLNFVAVSNCGSITIWPLRLM